MAPSLALPLHGHMALLCLCSWLLKTLYIVFWVHVTNTTKTLLYIMHRFLFFVFLFFLNKTMCRGSGSKEVDPSFQRPPLDICFPQTRVHIRITLTSFFSDGQLSRYLCNSLSIRISLLSDRPSLCLNDLNNRSERLLV